MWETNQFLQPRSFQQVSEWSHLCKPARNNWGQMCMHARLYWSELCLWCWPIPVCTVEYKPIIIEDSVVNVYQQLVSIFQWCLDIQTLYYRGSQGVWFPISVQIISKYPLDIYQYKKNIYMTYKIRKYSTRSVSKKSNLC